MAKIVKQSLADQIYIRLRKDILTLRYPLGSRINVNEVQDRLGVSSTPFREALNRLTQDGLVVMVPNIGASVLSLDAQDVAEIEEAAFTLQTAAVHLSLQRGDRQEMLNEIEDSVQRYAAATDSRDCLKAFFDLIGVFYHHCGNRRLDSTMIALQGQVLLLRYIYAECPGSQNNLDLLEIMRDGVKENNPNKILDALQEYSRRSIPAILSWLEAQKK